jgi:hypothetical protein
MQRQQPSFFTSYNLLTDTLTHAIGSRTSAVAKAHTPSLPLHAEAGENAFTTFSSAKRSANCVDAATGSLYLLTRVTPSIHPVLVAYICSGVCELIRRGYYAQSAHYASVRGTHKNKRAPFNMQLIGRSLFVGLCLHT